MSNKFYNVRISKIPAAQALFIDHTYTFIAAEWNVLVY